MPVETGPPTKDAFLRRLRTWLLLGNGAAGAMMLVLVVQWQAAILHSEQEDERSRVQGLALSISQTIAGQMDQVDLGLKNVTQQLQAMQGKSEPQHAQQVNAMLAAQLHLMPFLDGLMVTDAQGLVRYGGPLDPAHTIDLSTRAHFEEARMQHPPALLISQPVVSLATQRQSLFAVRRLELADGSFAGIVSAAINPAHFQRLFSAVKLGGKGVVSLRNDARKILARVVDGHGQDSFFGSAETSPELAHAFDSRAASGSFVSTVRQDGVERISAFQRVGDYPFMVIVGEGTGSYLVPWRAQVERIALLCALAMLTMAALSVVVYFAIRRETGGRSALQAALQRSQAWMDASPDGVHILDHHGTIVRASASLSALLGYHPDYLQGRNLALLTDLPLQDIVAPGPDTSGAQTVRKLQTQYRRMDGSLLDVELYICAVAQSANPVLYCSARDITPFLTTIRRNHEHAV